MLNFSRRVRNQPTVCKRNDLVEQDDETHFQDCSRFTSFAASPWSPITIGKRVLELFEAMVVDVLCNLECERVFAKISTEIGEPAESALPQNYYGKNDEFRHAAFLELSQRHILQTGKAGNRDRGRVERNAGRCLIIRPTLWSARSL